MGENSEYLYSGHSEEERGLGLREISESEQARIQSTQCEDVITEIPKTRPKVLRAFASRALECWSLDGPFGPGPYIGQTADQSKQSFFVDISKQIYCL